jgi:hypothetical protein
VLVFGEAITMLPVEEDNDDEFTHEYELAPLAIKVVEEFAPKQIIVLELIVTVGVGTTLTVIIDRLEHNVPDEETL